MQGVELVAFEETDHKADCHAAHLLHGLAHRGQPWGGGLGEVDVVEPGDGHVGRQPQSALGGGGRRPNGVVG